VAKGISDDAVDSYCLGDVGRCHTTSRKNALENASSDWLMFSIGQGMADASIPRPVGGVRRSIQSKSIVIKVERQTFPLNFAQYRSCE